MAPSFFSGCIRLRRLQRNSLLSLLSVTLLVSALRAQYEDSFLAKFDYNSSLNLSLAYDGNVGANNSGVEDTVLSGSVTTGAKRDFRFATLGLELTATASKYFDYDQLDHQNVYLNWIIDTDERGGNRRLSYSVNADISQDTATDQSVQGQTSERRINAGGQVSYLVSRSISIGTSIRYTKRDPLGKGKRLNENFEVVEVDTLYGSTTLSYSGWASYVQNPNLQYRLSVSRSVLDSERLSARNGHTDSANLSVIGQISPRINGSLSVGVQKRTINDEAANDTTPTFGASLSYQIDDLSSASLSGSRSFGTSLSGGSTDVTSFSLSYRRQISRSWNFSTSAQYQITEYVFPDFVISEDENGLFLELVDRKATANSLTLQASVGHQLTQNSRINLSVTWTDYDSDFRRGSASRNRAALSYTLDF